VGVETGPDVPVRVWSRAARLYDLQLPLERRALDAAVELAGAEPDDRLIDVATGTGGLLRGLAAARTRPDRAVGVDASESMLERVPPLPAGWELTQADARALPFPDASFDVATACYLLHFLAPTSRNQVLREVARVLRADGRLVVVTPAEPRTRVMQVLAAPVLTLARRSSGTPAGLRPLDPTRALRDAGFAVISVRRAAAIPVSTCVLAQRTR
jgi:ubiquinone/menaquinone biosynthesis C-methylase UbiE